MKDCPLPQPDIVYLGHEENPPPGERFLLLEIISGGRAEGTVEAQQGLTVQIAPASYAETLAYALDQAAGSDLAVIYVRGSV